MMEEARPSNVTNILRSLEKLQSSLLSFYAGLVDAKIDWIPQDVLRLITEKAMNLTKFHPSFARRRNRNSHCPSKSTPKETQRRIVLCEWEEQVPGLSRL